jgi:preprotein translocase subunit SecY
MSFEGLSLLTFASMVMGLLAHSMKQLIASKRNQAGVSIVQYYTDNLPETILATISAVVLWLGLPELAQLFPDLAKVLGVTDRQTVLSSFVVGFMANSLADFLGGRARAIAGT